MDAFLANREDRRKFDKWRRRAIKRLPEISSKIFSFRGKGYMGCGFHWSIEKSLGRSIYDLQNFDHYPREITEMIAIRVNFEHLHKEISVIEKELNQKQ